jgi:hypothetical protein
MREKNGWPAARAREMTDTRLDDGKSVADCLRKNISADQDSSAAHF